MTDVCRLFTSESVSAGHPDKMCDQISDRVLDALLQKDPDSRVACEAMVKGNVLIIAGEISSKTRLDYVELAREVIRDTAGCNGQDFGCRAEDYNILLLLSKQSAEVAKGVEKKGAGDQGTMFGYATRETESFMPGSLMPAPLEFAHRLMRRHAELRLMDDWDWLGPDAKAQVTVAYEQDTPVAVKKVVLSTQHRENICLADLRVAVENDIIRQVIPDEMLKDCKFKINPAGEFVKGGPAADCGLTGRKIIVDTYGGMARHGGGAMSGKDPTKVDRSAAYAARYIAKHLVASGLAERCEVQLSYAIGVAEPVAVFVDHFQTSEHSNQSLEKIVRECFELQPFGIIEMLDLRRPIYAQTAVFGHFGRDEPPGFTWERCDEERMKAIADAAGRY